MEKYIPPYTITNEMLTKISNIMEKIGKLDNYTTLDKTPYLRKQTKINSIHSSLAIENNKLTVGQVKDVINGKTVIGPMKEIQEVKNAYKAYEMLNDINPYNIDELKKVHGIMTYLTVDESGEFRKGAEGVFDGDKCIFVCPPPEMVNKLMKDLFKWLNDNKDTIHPLILSSIFHYEFVFIHPFSDGNGRMSRLWQNAILNKWKNIFEYLPIESQIHKYQKEYYDAIMTCNTNGNSNVFIEFMLDMIEKTLDERLNSSLPIIDNENININKLLSIMKENTPMTANEIMNKLGIKSKETLRNNYLDPAIKKEVINLTIPDKPTSKNQMYYKL
mgnify:FL=1